MTLDYTDADSRSRSKDTSPKTKRPCVSIQKPIAKSKLFRQQNLFYYPRTDLETFQRTATTPIPTNNHSDNKTYPKTDNFSIPQPIITVYY